MAADRGRVGRLKAGNSVLLYLLILLYLLAIVLFLLERSQGRERESLIKRFREFNSLAEEYRMIKASKAIEVGDVSEGLLPSINGLIDSIGLKDKVKSIKMAGNREFNEIIEERLEAEMDKLTMNELINLLYKLQTHPAHPSIKNVRIRKDFENPERLDMDIKVSFYRRK